MAEIGDGRGSPIRTRASSHPKQHINAFEKYDTSVEGRLRLRAVDKESADDGCVVYHVNSGLGCTWSN